MFSMYYIQLPTLLNLDVVACMHDQLRVVDISKYLAFGLRPLFERHGLSIFDPYVVEFLAFQSQLAGNPNYSPNCQSYSHIPTS